MSDAATAPFLMLTPKGTLHAYAHAVPDEASTLLQSLMANDHAPSRAAWLAAHPGQEGFLQHAMATGWVHEIPRALQAPDAKLDNYLPHVIGGMSGLRMAALASDDGFCLAHVGYSESEADALCAAAAELVDFVTRQRQRGWTGSGRAVSFHDDIDLLLPSTTLILFWVDGVGYWLILGGEPLVNNSALVQLVWGIRTAGSKFAPGTSAQADS